MLRPVHNTTLNNALRYVIFASMLVEMQHDARIDSDPILAFLCVMFLRLVVKKSPAFEIINLCVSRINAMQGLASLCEPAFSLVSSSWSINILTFSIYYCTLKQIKLGLGISILGVYTNCNPRSV